MSGDLPELPPPLVDEAVRRALLEDLGRAGDITSAATIPASATAEGVIAARKPGVIAGLALAAAAFCQMDNAIRFEPGLVDGGRVEPGSLVARLSGPARGILSAERVALNFLCHLSGVASATRRYADAIAHTQARITCTRKTTPGLRAFEKYAVRCGGGSNHRFGLDDAVLIKDNHIAVAGGVAEAIRRAQTFVGHLVKIEIEVDDLGQLEQALRAGADAILLDNMPPAMLAEAVRITAGAALLEASGGITLDTVAAVAETGVDFISSGAITHSAQALDLGLDVIHRA
jgi:nicotinate-nucleotide pyrophosphorylase (carboxylating)